MPVGWGQNVGLRDFCHILILLPPGASVFHKHMCSFYLVFKRSLSDNALQVQEPGTVPEEENVVKMSEHNLVGRVYSY